MGGQPVQRLHHRLVCQSHRLRNRLALDQLRRHRAGGDGRAAAEGLEFRILNNIVLDLQVDLHNIAALGVSNLADPVGIFDNADISWIAEMIHYFFTIQSHKNTSLNDKFSLAIDQLAPDGRHPAQVGNDLFYCLNGICDILGGNFL